MFAKGARRLQNLKKQVQTASRTIL